MQLMPNTSEETIDRLEQNIQSLEPVTAMLKSGMTPEDMLAKVLDGFELTVTDKREVGFVCDCSTQRVERSLAAISSDDLDEIIADDKPVEVRCQFCNHKYEFSIEQLKDIRNRRNDEKQA